MSRFSDQDKREILLGNGADPAIHDLTDDGFIVSKVSTAQPAITNTPVSPDTTKFEPLSPTGDSPLTTGIKSFAQAAPSGLAAGAGMGAGFAIGGALAPATGGLSFLIPLLTGLAGGGLAGMGARKVQEAVEPESWTANVEASRQLNPLAGDVGELASLVTSGFRPSIKNLTTTAGAIPKLLTGQSLTGAEKLAGMNVGLGTGLGIIQPTVESLATTGQLPAGSDLLKSAAVGSLLTEPWALGRKFGFHNSVVPRELPGIEDTVAAGGPVALNPQPDISGATVTPSDVSLLNRITGATWKDTKKGAQLVPAGTGTLSEVGAAETSARNMQEAFDKGLPTVENPGLRTFEIKAAEAEKSRQDWEEAKAQNEALKRAQTDNETARLKAENERMAEELKAGLQPKLEAAPLPPPKVTTELGREIHSDYTGVIEDANTQVKNESQADLEARRLEGSKDRYSEKSALEEAPIGTEFTGGVVNKIKEAGISPERTPNWRTKWGQFLQFKRNIKVVNGEVINEATGQRVAGRTIKDKVGNIVNEIDNVKGKLDTDAHEGIHGFIDSIRETPLYTRFEDTVSSSPEFQSINEQRAKAGAEPWTPEEFIATEQGYEFLDRNLGLKGETPLKTWWKDFSSHIKTKFGKGGKASMEDYRRILQYKFQNDKATSGAPGSVPMVNNQDTSQLEKPADKDWQVTVQPEEPGIPGTGYVQIDDITGGVNHWSKGPESLGKEGYNIPDFKKLPMGKYKYEDAVKKLGYSEKSELENEPSMYLTAPRIIEKLNIKQAGGGQWYGTLVNKINPFEMSMLKEAGIEDFLAPQTVHTGKEVADWIRANGPKVEVHSYGMEGKVSEAKKEYDKMTHEWYDSLSDGAKRLVNWSRYEEMTEGNREKAMKYLGLQDKVNNEPRDSSPRATSYYNTVSALDTTQPMPEWTATKSGKNVQRVDVVIPQKQKFNGKGVPDKEGNVSTTLWSPDNLHENLPNTLGWAMIQYKTGPKGEKIAVIAEAQSRWGQKVREGKALAQKHYADRIAAGEDARTLVGTNYLPEEHPLLRDYNRLILKSAIEQARKEGATHIVVSDAETAMMTEGHDVNNNAQIWGSKTIDGAKQIAKEHGLEEGKYIILTKVYEGKTIYGIQDTHITQEPGMRLNYDTILPKIAEELTGSKGERVSLGEHKNAYNNPVEYVNGQPRHLGYPVGERPPPRSNLIFRNADGTPKTDVSGRMYDISKTPEKFSLTAKRYSDKSELEYKSSLFPFQASRYDKIADTLKSPTARMVTDNLHKFESEKEIQTAKIGNKLIAAGEDYTKEEQQRVYRYAHQMSVDGKSMMTLSGREKKLYEARRDILRGTREDQNKMGIKVKAGDEYRTGGIDPNGYMFSILSPEVAYTISQKPESAEAKNFQKIYEDHMIKHGLSQAEAKEAFTEYKGALGDNKPRSIEFGALRKAAGVGLPWELVDQNFNSAAIRYGRRAGRDMAYYKWIQNDPKMLKALNLPDQFGKLPDTITEPDITDISHNSAVEQAKRSILGISDASVNPLTQAYARAVNNTIMGVGTAARNVANMPAFMATYVQGSQVPLAFKAIGHMNESRARAFENGSVKASFEDFDAAGYYLGNPNPTIRLLNRYSEVMRKYQGRNISDKFEGEYYYSLGELLATDNIAKAKMGNKESIAYVKKMGTTVEGGADSLLKRKVTQDDINRMAVELVNHARGTYGPSGLPSYAIEGQISPFFALSRFSIEKANTVWKDVIMPMKKGIYGPAIRYLLGSAGMGLAIEELNELLSNKRGGEAKISEIIASGSKEDLIPKFISTLQLASFAGIIGDGAQLVSNAARGKGLTYSNPISFPLYTMITDTWGRNLTDAANAIKEGEDPLEVIGKLATVLSTQSVQTMRYLDANVLNTKEAKRKEKFRDYNVWQELTDRKEPEALNKSDNFKNLGMKEFKREGDLKKAVSMIPDLLKQAISKSKDAKGHIDPVKLHKNIISLKLNSYQVMPALESDPRAFAEYYQYVSKAQGPEKAKALLADFLLQKQKNSLKTSMIPSL